MGADWRNIYRSRLRPLNEAMERILSGDLVAFTVLTPRPVIDAFLARARDLTHLDFRIQAPRDADLFSSEGPFRGKEIEFFIGDVARPAHDARVATYLPHAFSLSMKATDAGRAEARLPGVLLTPCSPPNEAGYVHFGMHLWLRKAYARRVRTTIAFVDPNLAPVHGDVWMHVSEIDSFVEGAIPKVDISSMERAVVEQARPEHQEDLLRLLRWATPEQLSLMSDTYHTLEPASVRQSLGDVDIDAAAQAVADNVRQIIRDGDTLQVGVGQPSALLFKAGAFDGAGHLGLHTEMGGPGLTRLWLNGNLDNSRKKLHRGRSVAVAWTGCDPDDLRVISNNPSFELHSPEDVLNPLRMAANPGVTSINSAIAIDLLGQIASEDRFGGVMVNGAGGQPDAHMAAALCQTGRAITVMRSTAVAGTVSKIVPKHEAGTLITIPRYLADTVVTEYGIARLMDKNHRQRAEELISIAHPDFRSELRSAAREMVGE